MKEDHSEEQGDMCPTRSRHHVLCRQLQTSFCICVEFILNSPLITAASWKEKKIGATGKAKAMSDL